MLLFLSLLSPHEKGLNYAFHQYFKRGSFAHVIMREKEGKRKWKKRKECSSWLSQHEMANQEKRKEAEEFKKKSKACKALSFCSWQEKEEDRETRNGKRKVDITAYFFVHEGNFYGSRVKAWGRDFDVWRLLLKRERKQRNTKLLPAFIFFRLYIRSPSGSPPSLLFTSHTFLSMYVFISCDSLIPAFEQREKEGNRPLVCVGEWVSLSASFSSLKVRGGRREDVIRKKKWESQVLLWVRVGTNCWQQKREEIKTVTWRTSRERMIERKVL